jgi:hypothetical protein
MNFTFSIYLNFLYITHAIRHENSHFNKKQYCQLNILVAITNVYLNRL